MFKSKRKKGNAYEKKTFNKMGSKDTGSYAGRSSRFRRAGSRTADGMGRDDCGSGKNNGYADHHKTGQYEKSAFRGRVLALQSDESDTGEPSRENLRLMR